MRQNTFVCKQEHEKRNYCYRNVIVFKCISAFIGASFGCGDKSTFRNEHVTWKILMVKFAARQKVKHTEVIRYGIQYTIVNVCIAHATVSLERRSPLCVSVCVFARYLPFDSNKQCIVFEEDLLRKWVTTIEIP